MNKIFFAILTLIFTPIILQSKPASKLIIQKKEFHKNDNYENHDEVTALIFELFKQKKIDIKSIPQPLVREFEFKKNCLATELVKLSMLKISTQEFITKARATTGDIFDTFTERLKYIKISNWGQRLISAINIHKNKSNPQPHSSAINIGKDELYLLTKMP